MAEPVLPFSYVTYWPLTDLSVRDFVNRMHLCKESNWRNESHEFATWRWMHGQHEYYIRMHSFIPRRQTVSQEKQIVRAEAVFGTALGEGASGLVLRNGPDQPCRRNTKGALDIELQWGKEDTGQISHSVFVPVSLSPLQHFNPFQNKHEVYIFINKYYHRSVGYTTLTQCQNWYFWLLKT